MSCPVVIDMSMSMLDILGAGYVAMSVTQVLSGVMRGAGDTMTPMWITLVTTIGLRLPLAYGLVAITKNAGAEVTLQQAMVFVSLLISWLIGMIITIIVYRHGSWRKKMVIPSVPQEE